MDTDPSGLVTPLAMTPTSPAVDPGSLATTPVTTPANTFTRWATTPVMNPPSLSMDPAHPLTLSGGIIGTICILVIGLVILGANLWYC